MKTITTLLLLFIGLAITAQPMNNCECVAPDNGSGTIDIPPNCPDSTEIGDPLLIIDGLPPGTTVEIAAEITNYINQVTAPGGNLGGEVHTYDAQLITTMTGTGALVGFNRMISIPVAIELHSGPRIPGDAVQTFPIDLFSIQGEVFGDPDFDQLQITGGTGFGLPSPGQMTLTELPGGEFNVESFYDLNYRIDFVGAPGSVLDGLSGSTQATSRLSMGSECIVPPIPTLSQWGIIVLALIMLTIGLVFVRKQKLNIEY